MREGAISMCKKLELMLQDCVSIEAIKAGKKHLNAAFTAITSIQSNKEETHFLAKK